MIHIHPRNILSAVTLAWTILLPSILPAQNKSESSATTVTRSNIGNVVTSRRDSHDNNSRKNTADTRWDAPNPNVEWMRIIYRQIDLDNEKNAALYYPELPIEGKENLFRLTVKGTVHDSREASCRELVASSWSHGAQNQEAGCDGCELQPSSLSHNM